MPRRTAVVAALAVLAASAAGCGSSSAATESPAALLHQAKATVDAAPSLHFALTSAGATGSGIIIIGGTGDAARPDKLQATFQVADSGLPVTVKVLAAGGKFYAQLPFQSGYAPTDPSQYGIGNPAQLIDPSTGLSSLLPAMTGLRSLGQARVDGDVVDRVSGTLPGSKLTVLPDVAPSQPVDMTVDVATGSHQVRQLVLRGPFSSASPSTYTVTLTGYGEAVHITPPAG